jgi:hypothetical protein
MLLLLQNMDISGYKLSGREEMQEKKLIFIIKNEVL